MPCVEWFQGSAARVPATRPAAARTRPGQRRGWRSDRLAGWVGEDGEIVSINHFGASAEGAILFEEFGFTPDHVVAAARATLSRTGGIGEGATGN
jgi:Transketolase